MFSYNIRSNTLINLVKTNVMKKKTSKRSQGMQTNTMRKYRTVKKVIKQALQKCKEKLPKQAKNLSKTYLRMKRKRRECRRTR